MRSIKISHELNLLSKVSLLKSRIEGGDRSDRWGEVRWGEVRWCGVVWCGVVWCGVVRCGDKSMKRIKLIMWEDIRADGVTLCLRRPWKILSPSLPSLWNMPQFGPSICIYTNEPSYIKRVVSKAKKKQNKNVRSLLSSKFHQVRLSFLIFSLRLVRCNKYEIDSATTQREMISMSSTWPGLIPSSISSCSPCIFLFSSSFPIFFMLSSSDIINWRCWGWWRRTTWRVRAVIVQ